MATDIREEAIRLAIGSVTDPDLDLTLGQLKAIHDIKIDGRKVEVYLELIPPLNWTAEKLDKLCRDEIFRVDREAQPMIYVREKTIPRVANANVLSGVKNLIAVASGKGGVGKSTIAANIAAALRLQGATVGLLDADIYGPSAPTMFGLAGETLKAEKTPDGKIIGYPHEEHGVKVASIGFVMQRDQAAILRGPMLAGYFSTLVDQIQWGQLDFLIFDLPPGTGDVQLTLTQKVPLTGAVIVTTPQEISLADVRRSIAMFERVNVKILGVVENMSYFIPPDMPEKKYHIFGEGGGRSVADESKVPFLGEVPINIGMRVGADEGTPAVLNRDDQAQAQVIKDIVASLVREVRRANLRAGETPTVQISL